MTLPLRQGGSHRFCPDAPHALVEQLAYACLVNCSNGIGRVDTLPIWQRARCLQHEYFHQDSDKKVINNQSIANAFAARDP
ncbi:MAG: hypothetical protein JJU07_10305 [Natronohydrobacter sp.]|nr:hypothetical protein [Natronohydrobacter sp.]